MGYTIVQFPKLGYTVVQGALGPESRLEPLPEGLRPGGTCLYSDLSGLDGDDPGRRVELWETSTGIATEAEIMAACPHILEPKVAALWQAAHDYEFQQISGSAVGLLVLGVMQGKPKCTSVQNWIKDIWSLYYQRKGALRFDTIPDTDYSAAGPIPYTVPELMAEVGV